MTADMKPSLSNVRRSVDEQTLLRPLAMKSIPEPASISAISANTAPVKSAALELNVSVTAAIIAINREAPMVLTVTSGGIDALPSTLFQPDQQSSLDHCLRYGVFQQTGLNLGYAEQLLTSADGGNGLGIGYMALTRTTSGTSAGATWRSWYDYLPWEDWRNGRPQILATHIEPRLRSWATSDVAAPDASRGSLTRIERVRMAFGMDRTPWNEERVTDRFDLLTETGLIGPLGTTSRGMRPAHVRMLASAVGRLRAKLKIRPVIFELMDTEFTLFELQKTVEAILGPHLHKQNFRRLIESAGLVEPTGDVRSKTGGRPAKLFRFRHEVLMERPAPGVRVHTQHA
jgi:hypothetical protein